ncbi:hypothetical protein ACFCXP_11240 [Streptomyces niveus]|uniref:hypothetical protein n=1 Tax=Streptomyces niveus TaxID=193462 RepID=UPI0035D6BD1B
MADSEDQAMERLAHHISMTYGVLATLCLSLPVAVTLPTGLVSNLDVVPAVRRMMDIIEDQPMPEEQQATLFAACSFWLGAMDLYGLLTRDFHIARANSAAACLLMCDDTMNDLIVWLAETQK